VGGIFVHGADEGDHQIGYGDQQDQGTDPGDCFGYGIDFNFMLCHGILLKVFVKNIDDARLPAKFVRL
jgi:hypothetical protein